MNYAYKSLLSSKMAKVHSLSQTIQVCTLTLLLFMASNSRSAESASAAQSTETNADQPVAEIRSVLKAQQEAWNRGDVDGFMRAYARSDSTVFVSDDQITRGWQTVRNRYKLKYASRAKMGKLRFSDLEIQPLGNDAAVVLGRWILKRATNDNPHGLFTLIFRRTADGWRIVQDHTSTAP
jgi:ketosteroid isomerase-like protein